MHRVARRRLARRPVEEGAPEGQRPRAHRRGAVARERRHELEIAVPHGGDFGRGALQRGEVVAAEVGERPAQPLVKGGVRLRELAAGAVRALLEAEIVRGRAGEPAEA